ncbi:MAG: hypothetical protein KDE54_23690 [Caldilineaceae bacterium]|nr:hypothetical protein [Caldilineaceae bacterium]MCB9148259.1 hypothetical protein [Caldilineaceae bacterium]
MRTLGQLGGRILIVLLAAGIVIGGTWFVGNQFGSEMSGPPSGQLPQVSQAAASADAASSADTVASSSDTTTSSSEQTFAPPTDGRPEGGHHGNASMSSVLFGMAQNTAIILMIVLIIVGIEKVLTWKKKTVGSMV